MRHDHDAVGPTGGGQIVDHLEDVGSAPGLGGASGALPRHAPARPAAQTGGAGDRRGRREQLVGIRIADQHPLGERVRREHDLGPLRHLRQRRPKRCALMGDELGKVVPVVDAVEGHVALGRRCRTAGVVLADREAREVRREHDPDDRRRSGVDECGHAVLDERGRVLLAEPHEEATGPPGLERRGDCRPLGLGPGGQRRDAADRLVPGDQVGELMRLGRTPSADVGVVRLDLRHRRRRAVGHDEHTDGAAHVGTTG